MVELLISSDIAKYCEFKTISRVLTYINGKLEQVSLDTIFILVVLFWQVNFLREFVCSNPPFTSETL